MRSTTPSLTVADVQASLGWYRDVVGFSQGESWEEDGKVIGAELLAGSERIILSQDDGGQGRERKKGVGFRLHFGTAQDVDEVAEGVRARGGRLASEPADTPWGTRAFTLVDPDGFKLTISSEP